MQSIQVSKVNLSHLGYVFYKHHLVYDVALSDFMDIYMYLYMFD